MSSTLKRTEIPILIFAVMMIIPILGDHFDIPVLATVSNEILRWGSYIAAFALFLGVYAALRYHSKQITMKVPGRWYFSVFVILMMAIMFITGFVAKDTQQWIFNKIWIPAQTSIFTFVGFFMFSAIYRAFKARNLEVAVLLVAAVCVSFSIAPFAGNISPILPALGDWVNAVPNLAGQRGILIGVAIGLIAMAVRTVLGYEKALIGGGEE